jgi:succinoglycan biosynthesis transport protein ExoP
MTDAGSDKPNTPSAPQGPKNASPRSDSVPAAQSWPAFDAAETFSNGLSAPPAIPVVKLTPVAILRALRRRWLLGTTLGLLLGSLSAVGLWFVRPAQFTTYALLRISPGQTRVLPESSADQRSGDDQNYQKTQVALIKSRPVIRGALRNPAALQTELIRQQPDPVVWLEGELQVAFLEGSDIARIALTGRIPADLAVLVNAVKDAYLE